MKNYKVDQPFMHRNHLIVVNGMNVKCDYCGKEFLITRDRRELPRLYCCDECAKNIISSGHIQMPLLSKLGIDQARAYKLGWTSSSKQNKREYTCVHCDKPFERSGKKITKVACCDECAVKFIQQGLNTNQLEEKGVNYVRAVKLGWVAPQRECDVCHRLFLPVAGQTLCRMPGCPSASERKLHPRIKIRTMYKRMENEPACKTVICTPMNKYRDALLAAMPGFITVDDFNETRKKIMIAKCRSSMTPRCAAAAIFYITLKRMQIDLPAGGQTTIARTVGTNEVTLRTYYRKFKPLFPEID